MRGRRAARAARPQRGRGVRRRRRAGGDRRLRRGREPRAARPAAPRASRARCASPTSRSTCTSCTLDARRAAAASRRSSRTLAEHEGLDRARRRGPAARENERRERRACQPRDDLRALEGYHSPQVDVRGAAQHQREPVRAARRVRRRAGSTRCATSTGTAIPTAPRPRCATRSARSSASRRRGCSAANGSNEVLQTLLLTYGGAGPARGDVRADVRAARAHRADHRHRGRRRATRRPTSRSTSTPRPRSIARRRPVGRVRVQPEQPDRHGRDRATRSSGSPTRRGRTRRAARRRRGVRRVRAVERGRARRRRPPARGGAHVLEGVVARRGAARVRGRARVGDRRAREGAAAVHAVGADAGRGHGRARLPRRDGAARRRARRGARPAVRGARRDRRACTSCPSGANFLLFRVDGDAHDLWKRLLDRGVLVRDFSSWPRVEGCLRVTVGTPAENDAFLAALARYSRRYVSMSASGRSCSARRRRRRSTLALDVDGTGTTKIVDRHPVLRPHARAARQARAASTSRSTAKGDLDVDLHHTVEDVGIVLGNALREALGDKARRAPLRRTRSCRSTKRSCRSRSTCRAGRSSSTTSIRSRSGSARSIRNSPRSSGRASSTARASRCTCAASSGKNGHHVIEASFKGVARALRDAVRVEGDGVPSHQGHAVELTVDDRGRRLRDREPAVGGEGAAAPRRRRAAHHRRRRDRSGRRGRAARRRRFGACMRALRDERPRSRSTKEAATDGRPFLGICVGMQMLFDGSDESPDVAGPRRRRRAASPACPTRCGCRRWVGTRSRSRPGVALVRRARPIPRGCYFVHSFAPEPADDAVVAAWCDVRPPVRGRDRSAARCGRRSSTPRRAATSACALLRNFVDGSGDATDGSVSRRSTCAAGDVVRLQQGDYDARRVYGDDPVAVARGFDDAGRALDPRRRPRRGAATAATRTSRVDRGDLRRRVACKVQTGGGVRTVDDASERFAAGVAARRRRQRGGRASRSSSTSSRRASRARSRSGSTRAAATSRSTAGPTAPGSTSSTSRSASTSPGVGALVVTEIVARRHAAGPGPRPARGGARRGRRVPVDRERRRRRRSTTSARSPRSSRRPAARRCDRRHARSTRAASPSRKGSPRARSPRDPVPRRRRGPRREGRALRRASATPAIRSSSRRATTPKAPTSSCSSTSPRRPTTATRWCTSSSGSPTQVFIPFTVGGGSPHRRRRAPHAARRRRQGLAQHRRGRTIPSSSRAGADEFGAQCIVVAIDARRRNADDPARAGRS